MKLHELGPAKGARKTKKRLGRGMSSGLGKTSGRGHKGQNSRSGGGVRCGFEGGQMPLIRRLPKRGFHNRFRKEYAIINISELDRFNEGEEVTPQTLKKQGIIKNLRDGVKILGDGELKKKLTVSAHKFSKAAVEKIEAAAGEIKVL